MNARTLTPNFDLQTILSKTEIRFGECWMWKGSKYQSGYGKYGKAGYMAHRIAYELLKGPIPTGMFLDHTCHTRNCIKGMKCEHRSCINPDHLEVVTKGENVLRGNSLWAVNARKTHCLHGHEFIDGNISRTTTGGRRCRKCHSIAENKRRQLKTWSSERIEGK